MGGDGDEAFAAAKEILDTADGMKSVHSTQSVAAMVRSSAQGERQGKSSILSASSGVCDLLECHPRKPAAKQFFFEVHHPHTLLVPPGLRRDGVPVKVCKECAGQRLSGLQLLPLGTPLQASHDQADGTRMEVQNAVNKLPYMNRNPAV